MFLQKIVIQKRAIHIFLLSLLFAMPFFVHAHGESVSKEVLLHRINDLFSYNPLMVTGVLSVVIILLTIILFFNRPQNPTIKTFSFSILVVPILLGTFYITGDTLLDIKNSPTGGPVHWHADFRVFACGQELDLVDPKGLSNRVGTSEVHEHGDNRIHIEGILSTLKEASLGDFFDVVGGELTSDTLRFPTNTGLVSFKNGETCPNTTQGTLQVFLWETEDNKAFQSRLTSFPSYVMNPEAIIPPGDCIIIEFDQIKDRTEYLCEQYEVAEIRGDLDIIR